jgi:hypothetical protein
MKGQFDSGRLVVMFVRTFVLDNFRKATNEPLFNPDSGLFINDYKRTGKKLEDTFKVFKILH